MSNNDKGATPRTDKAVSGEYAGSLDMEQVLSAVVEHARTLEREAEETKSALIGARVLIEELRAAHEASQARAARLEEALIESQLFLTGPMGYSMDDFMVKQNHEALDNSPNWLQERLKAERERAAKVCENEELTEDLGDPGDDVYNQAVQDCAAAIRALPEGE